MISNLQSNSYTAEASENTIKISMAITPEEKREIYHLRYQIYVEEMSKNIEDVDYNSKLLYDELDEWGFLLYVKINSTLIATLRINIGYLTDFPTELKKVMSFSTFTDRNIKNDNRKIAYSGKLMIAPSHRNSSVLYLLIAKGYELFYTNHVKFSFCLCNFHLLRLYEQMGFRRYSQNFLFPGYGLVTPIVLLVDDIKYLRTVRSPFFRLARKREIVDTQETEWFYERFIRNSPIINSQLITEEDLWSILRNDLSSLPTDSIALIHQLSEAEAKRFLYCCGSLVHCDTGDIITSQGDTSYSYNILISGKLKSLTFRHSIQEYNLPGQHFGANGLTEHNKNTEDIAATTPAQILVLSGMAFPRFFHSQPEIAHKIIQTMKNLTNKLGNM